MLLLYSKKGLHNLLAKTRIVLTQTRNQKYQQSLTKSYNGSAATTSLFHSTKDSNYNNNNYSIIIASNRHFSTCTETTITACCKTPSSPSCVRRGVFPSPHANLCCFSSCGTAPLLNQWASAGHSYFNLAQRHYSSQADDKENKDSNSKTLSIFQRFKLAYKQHGKVLVGVHVATSVVWFGCFYYLAQSGFDIVPILEKLRVSESIIASFKKSGVGDVASAYLMYKVATPARYTVTLAGTNLAIRYFRKTGRMKPVPESSKFRVLYKDSKKYLNARRKQLNKRQMVKMKKRLKKFQKFNKFKKRSR